MIALKNIQSKKNKDKLLQSSAGLKESKSSNNTLKTLSGSNLKLDFKDLYILCKLG